MPTDRHSQSICLLVYKRENWKRAWGWAVNHFLRSRPTISRRVSKDSKDESSSNFAKHLTEIYQNNILDYWIYSNTSLDGRKKRGTSLLRFARLLIFVGFPIFVRFSIAFIRFCKVFIGFCSNFNVFSPLWCHEKWVGITLRIFSICGETTREERQRESFSWSLAAVES